MCVCVCPIQSCHRETRRIQELVKEDISLSHTSREAPEVWLDWDTGLPQMVMQAV